MPLFSTPTQFAVLALLLIAGWLFGLASHPGGRKWKQRYVAERDAHAAARKDGDIRTTAAEKRVAELERENARLAKAVPVAQPVVQPVAQPAAQPAVQSVAQPAGVAHPSVRAVETRAVDSRAVDSGPVGTVTTRAVAMDGTRRGWFEFGNR